MQAVGGAEAPTLQAPTGPPPPPSRKLDGRLPQNAGTGCHRPGTSGIPQSVNESTNLTVNGRGSSFAHVAEVGLP